VKSSRTLPNGNVAVTAVDIDLGPGEPHVLLSLIARPRDPDAGRSIIGGVVLRHPGSAPRFGPGNG